MQRFAVLGLGLALVLAAALPQARADEYPSRPIRLIIGFPPGSAADISARVVGDVMSRTLGQQVIIEAKPGAGSSLAGEFVARSPADGYTLYMNTTSNVTNAAIQTNLRFDYLKDFAPITPLTGLPLILAVHPSLGVSTIQELIALAKQKPSELTYASVGPGTVGHLALELISVRTGIKLTHVPYPGSPPGVADLVAGRVSMTLGVASTVWPHVESGRLKALATCSGKRSPGAPNVPTISETVLPNFDCSVWFGLAAPTGTPRPVIDRLAAAANAALKQGDVAGRLRAAGFEPLGSSPDEFAAYIAREDVKWRAAALAAGFKK